MKTFVIKWMLLCLFISANAQSDQVRIITGIVTEKSTNNPIPGALVSIKGINRGTTSDVNGKYSIDVPTGATQLVFSSVGYVTQEIAINNQQTINVALAPDTKVLSEVVVTGYATKNKRSITGSVATMAPQPRSYPQPNPSTESYKATEETGFQNVRQQPVTTFSADVDRASYSNIRRLLNNGQRPPKDAVRLEEMINYFSYQYPQPAGETPLSITTELTESPWNSGLQLLRVGLQARRVKNDKLPPSNLVFLLDVSGSMNAANKLPLVQASLNLLVDQLRPVDRVAIVVYAGAAGLVLPPTSGNQPQRIKDAINQLHAGGSTAGGAGIELAYKVAKDNWITNGNNRVILATDGDFNVGLSGEGELQRLIEQERKKGIFLSVLGFGMGNLKDDRLETLADKGNGNYAYIDNLPEARKVFINEFGGTLFTVAKDVKLQLEFNPAYVQAYRLLGYENRRLANEDFKNDQKDAGDLGAGHSVTAIYELIPAGTKSRYLPKTDSLKYQTFIDTKVSTQSGELVTLKVRYKQPADSVSQQLQHIVKTQTVPFNRVTADFRFAAAVAEFGLLLSESSYKGSAGYGQVVKLAKGALTDDSEGYRSEFVRLVKTASGLTSSGEVVDEDKE
ncbi:von Willebrand factor type A domain-containing protein [Spirosoma sp. BT702]|uniref:von Willebrand factor type A domain-containing protein n=1 Tax=Spirosoma profusum TaxID=2771354 RepID=A0A927AVZ1_9BACT|nr:VWA domain-containing protein [Spirosoma profusum]MBD2705386.1 von Willebrand factor type A domain-containing protein [Spirosoma profusum]